MQVQRKQSDLVENPVAFQKDYVYNVMGAEKNKRRKAAFVFFKPINEQPVCEADSRARQRGGCEFYNVVNELSASADGKARMRVFVNGPHKKCDA